MADKALVDALMQGRAASKPSPVADALLKDKVKQRAYLAPWGITEGGERTMAVPGVLMDAYNAFALPGRVYRGEEQIYDESGRVRDEVIKGATDLAGMVTLGSGAVPAKAGEMRAGIKAYHGSPHDFDRFDMSKIGTGEGAQAYGHGLYFAENEATARAYRDALTYKPSITEQVFSKTNASALYKGLSVADANQMDELIGKIGDARSLADANKDVSKLSARARALYSERIAPLISDPQKGSMYEVNINADPADFLDWDAPLGEQPAKIRQSLGWTPEAESAYRAANKQDTDNLLAALLGDADYKETPLPVPKGLPPLSATGADIVKGNSIFDSAADVRKTAALRSAGIPGIKYLDQGSRNAGDGTRNYVVFDDKLISIVRKYGIATAVAMGLVSQEDGQRMKEQGLVDG